MTFLMTKKDDQSGIQTNSEEQPIFFFGSTIVQIDRGAPSNTSIAWRCLASEDMSKNMPGHNCSDYNIHLRIFVFSNCSKSLCLYKSLNEYSPQRSVKVFFALHWACSFNYAKLLRKVKNILPTSALWSI